MAATFEWDEANGAEVETHNIPTTNYKNVDNTTETAGSYQSNPIVAGTNSFGKWKYGHFTAPYSMIEAGLWSHQAGAIAAQITLFGSESVVSDATTHDWEAPNTGTAGEMATPPLEDVTAVTATPDRGVWFGGTTPATAVKTASTTDVPTVSSYIVTQLRTTGTAPAGELSNTITLMLRYDES